MGLPKPQPLTTVDEYLASERQAIERHEFLDGQVHAMAGESGAHADISANVVGSLVNQLKGKPCRARTKDTKVRSGPAMMAGHGTSGLFSYPDIVVVCGEPEYHDAHTDVILNPTTIVEVLSPGTEAFDRGAKFTRYQTWNPTLTDYVLISQDQPQIEHFIRQTDGSWSYHRYTDLNSSFTIASIGCTLTLADVYDRVVFPPSDEGSA
jgi:Uma2 family endonuclease